MVTMNCCNIFPLSSLFHIVFLFLAYSVIPVNVTNSNISSYIIFTNDSIRPTNFLIQNDWYSSMISSLSVESVDFSSRIFYTYDAVITGFAARLTNEEAENLKKMPGVSVVVEDSVTTELHTTRSPDFLGLKVNSGLSKETNAGESMIIGFIDSGIWPESQSFNDEGLGPVRSSWRGSCEFDAGLCNNKLVGAKAFSRGLENLLRNTNEELDDMLKSPRDTKGHGTHTASTAAGAAVPGANLFGFAGGIARGIATNARVAMYKACYSKGCAESDVLSAISSAISDGVDILSMSIGSPDAPHYENAINLGAFAAVRNGIFVVCSAGNDGPRPYSVQNTAPWIMTVGAGSVDRSFPVQIMLENGKAYVGSSLYTSVTANSQFFPLLYLGSCGSMETPYNKVLMKIAVCGTAEIFVFDIALKVQAAGGVGLILLNQPNQGEGLAAVPVAFPAVIVGFKEGLEILRYINAAENPLASFKFDNLTVIGKDRAPILASFSSRGPNPIVPEVLKPDIIAPGFNILAAFPPNLPPTMSQNDPRRVHFNIMSGTSMACPHVAGAAALLKASHPDWSPAAIRSALMTTSSMKDTGGLPIARYEDVKPATYLGIGAGHINPQMAADPGLIYDSDVFDYTKFLCSLGYNVEQMKAFDVGPHPCSVPSGSPGNLNYPSFSVVFKQRDQTIELRRTVKNVGGLLPEIYEAKVFNPRPDKVSITVAPSRMTFNGLQEKQTYIITFRNRYVARKTRSQIDEMVFAVMEWHSDEHKVQSPIAIMWFDAGRAFRTSYSPCMDFLVSFVIFILLGFL